MLERIDLAPMTHQQKLRFQTRGLSWPLLVEEFPTTSLDRELQSLATSFLKRWSGLSCSANTAILYLSPKRGGLGLPSLTGFHKKQQSIRMTQLFCSTDAGIHHVAKLQLQDERGKKRQKFKPATLVDDLRAQDPPKTRKGRARAAKAFLATEEADERSEQLCSLPVQGDMARRFEGNAAELWVRAVQDLPSDVMKFALNASLEILATNVNLHTWGKETNTICALYSQEHQTLLHVLNACPKAMVL